MFCPCETLAERSSSPLHKVVQSLTSFVHDRHGRFQSQEIGKARNRAPVIAHTRSNALDDASPQLQSGFESGATSLNCAHHALPKVAYFA
jgi:hypothetical protein